MICGHERLDAAVSLVVRRSLSRGASGIPASPLAFPSRARPDLFLGLLLAPVPDSRPAWSQWPSPCRSIPQGSCKFPWRFALLVCAHASLARQQRPCIAGPLLDRHDRFTSPGAEYLASSDARDLLRDVSFLRFGGAGFFRVPVGWHAAGGRIRQLLFRPWRLSSRLCSVRTSLSSESFSAATPLV